MNRTMIAALAAFLALHLAGCSYSNFKEGYDPDGGLKERTWTSTQVGTTRQSIAKMDQTDGNYSTEFGETVDTSEQFVELVRVPANLAGSIYGMGQLRRGDALAPVSVNQAGAMGLQSQPITAEQQAVYAEREATARLRAELEAELEKFRAEVEAHRAASEAGHEPAPAPGPAD